MGSLQDLTRELLGYSQIFTAIYQNYMYTCNLRFVSSWAQAQV